MNLFSVLFYCTAILNFTSGYVLLAANMEDFRSLARQFVPDSMADEILEMARAALERDKTKAYNAQYFRNDHAVTTDALDSYEDVTVRSVRKKLVNKPRDGTTSKYELTLDDLVEKVKQRLKSELELMAASAAKKHQHNGIPSTRMPTDGTVPDDSSDVQETNQSPNREKPQERYEDKPDMIEENKPYEEEQHEKKVKPKREKQTDNRYVAEMFVAQPPKYLYDLGKPVTVKEEDIPRLGIPKIKPKQTNNKKSLRQIKRIAPTRGRITTTTTEGPNLFKGVDLVNKNDSYEDYVIPKKDEDYVEPETAPLNHKTVQKNPYIQKQPLNHKANKQEEVSDVFSDEDEATTKVNEHVNYEDETINYNKKKRVIKNIIVEKEVISNNNKHSKQRPSNREVENPASAEPLAAVNVGHQIQPYEEQVEEPDNVEEFEQPVTEELKARSEIITYNDNTPISQHVAPQIKNNNKNKRNQKPKLGTVIPKRDGYKMTSPNYLVKLPIVGEKYHFDEPIPEDDRVPEKLEPMKDLKSIINGKVVLL